MTGVYVHIPFCHARCKYCAFISTTNDCLQRDYITALCKEISTSKTDSVDTVFFGGGTPSCLYRGGLTIVMNALKSRFTVLPNSEVTVEANPESCNGDFVDEIVSCSVNRVSLGLQTTNEKLLKSIGRIHSVKQFVNAVKLLQSRNIANINADCIIGLQDQTAKDVIECIDLLANLNLTHISVYALSVEEGTPLFKEGYKTDDDSEAQLYDVARSALMRRGYERYEVSNFCKRGFQCKHNLKYWNLQPYVGFGVSAHGYDGKYRYANTDSISEYLKGKEPECEDVSRDGAEEYIMLKLRTSEGFSLQEFSNLFNYDLRKTHACVLNELLSCKKIDIIENDRLKIHDDSLYVMNSIVSRLI